MIRIPIRYVFVEEAPSNRTTVLYTLSAGEVRLLRCFMTLLLLPADSGDMISKQPPFTAALSRLRNLPSFRKIWTDSELPQSFLDDLANAPLLVLMMGYSVPKWVEFLAHSRNIGVLSPSRDVIESLKHFSQVHTGLLQGMEDFREAYRVYGKLFETASTDQKLDEAVRSVCQSLSKVDLFNSRPRLEFIPRIPLPPMEQGRPAAYLINRLSNNVDEAVLSEGGPGNALLLPQMLEWTRSGCAALAHLENNLDIPKNLGISSKELQEIYDRLISPKEEAQIKVDLLMNLGLQLTKEEPLRRPFFTIAAPRLDLARGKVPETVKLDPGHKESARSLLKVVKDYLQGKQQTTFSNKREQEEYESARFTMLSELRLISCQTAWLAALCNSIPIQLSPAPGQLYNVLNDLNRALEANSRKIPVLFQQTEILLSQALPPALLEHIAKGSHPIIFFSDLPFEWALVGEWPVCLTRPVSRIPLGMSHWDIQSIILQQPIKINVKKPEKVLVFDLIEAHDPIRSDSDAFAAVSTALTQNYKYASPQNAEEFQEILKTLSPDIVVLDTHGSYDRRQDKLLINLKEGPVPLDDLLSHSRVPPLWILSACHTAVTGALRGSFVRELLRRGAACVVATLNRIDASMASMFVGKLLTEIFNPMRPGSYQTFEQAFFATQYTTALLYDPLWPLLRLSQRDSAIRDALGFVLGEYFKWVGNRELDIQKHRHEVAHVLAKLLEKYGLTKAYEGLKQAGQIRPETLLFTAFGVPSHIELVDEGHSNSQKKH